MQGSVLDTRYSERTKQVSTQQSPGKHRLAVKELPTVSLLSLLHLGTHPFASCVLINLYVTNLFVCWSLPQSRDWGISRFHSTSSISRFPSTRGLRAQHVVGTQSLWAALICITINKLHYKDYTSKHRISLVVQWLRIHLAMGWTQVWSLVGKLRYHMPQSN